jgi:hypothetical protein
MFIQPKLIKQLFAITILISTILPAFADDDDHSTNAFKRPIEELFMNDLVYPQDKGEWEFELASIYQNNRTADTFTMPLSVEYGLSDRWQVEAEWDSFINSHTADGGTASGIGDLELGTQYSFMSIAGSEFHIAPRFTVGIPLGDVNRGLSEGFMEYEPAVIIARDFPNLHRTQIFTEIGVNFVQRVKFPTEEDDADPAAHELNVGAGFFTPWKHGAVSLEFNCVNNTWNHHGQENQVIITPGGILKLPGGFEIGVAIPVGLNRQSDRYDVIAHIVWEF